MITNKATETWYQLTGRSLPNSSFLNMMNIQQDEDGEFMLNIFRNYDLNKITTNDQVYYTSYIMEDKEFSDNISNNIYNDSQLWWLVCLMNDVINPFEYDEAGKELKILKSAYVPTVLSNITIEAGK